MFFFGMIALDLLGIVDLRTQNSRSVTQGLASHSWIRDIIGGLSVVTMGQFIRLWNRIQVIVVEPDTIDRFEWIWTVDKCFSACSASGSLRGAPIDLCVGPSRNARPPQVQILRVEGGMESLVGRVIGGSVVAWPTRYLF